MEQVSDRELCNIFGVAIYPVEAFCETPPADEAGKFVVTTLDGTFENVSETIPLADTEEAAEALAVERLGLRALHASRLVAEA